MNTPQPNTLEGIASKLYNLEKNIILIYAFNGTGKTRLCVEYKNVSKANNEGNHAGVYYNAYSEDLFVWDHDDENDGANVQLRIQKSSLNQYHNLLNEDTLREKLEPYKPKYEFSFNAYQNVEEGIESIYFTLLPTAPAPILESTEIAQTESQEASTSSEAESPSKGAPEEQAPETAITPPDIELPIKISRGEERIFIWCFFQALFEIETLAGEEERSSHFFIDDPVSSLDDHNIFVTAFSTIDLIEKYFKERKIIITTHHIGYFAILANWLSKGEKVASYKDHHKLFILKRKESGLHLASPKREVFLYHLELLQILKKAIDDGELYAYHFALLRQILENVGSFLGVGRFSYILEQIGYSDAAEVAQIVNVMNHKNIFRYEATSLVPDNENRLKEIFSKLVNKYGFVLHAN